MEGLTFRAAMPQIKTAGKKVAEAGKKLVDSTKKTNIDVSSYELRQKAENAVDRAILAMPYSAGKRSANFITEQNKLYGISQPQYDDKLKKIVKFLAKNNPDLKNIDVKNISTKDILSALKSIF